MRDIDLFMKIVANGGSVQVNMTVTSDSANDEDVRRTFEPGCPSNRARLGAIAEVQAAGIQSCITMTPLLLVDDVDLFANEVGRRSRLHARRVQRRVRTAVLNWAAVARMSLEVYSFVGRGSSGFLDDL